MTTGRTTMTHERILSVVDRVDDEALKPARDAVARGADVTVLIALDGAARAQIRRHAAETRTGIAHAARTWETALSLVVRSALGASVDVTLAWHEPEGWEIMDAAASSHATSITIPAAVAGRRGYRRHMARTTVPVTLTPDRAA